jgi:hypothetical protein
METSFITTQKERVSLVIEKTLHSILNIIENNTEKILENDYIEITNGLMKIHNNIPNINDEIETFIAMSEDRLIDDNERIFQELRDHRRMMFNLEVEKNQMEQRYERAIKDVIREKEALQDELCLRNSEFIDDNEYICDCGLTLKTSSKNRHNNSLKHKDRMESIYRDKIKKAFTTS